jgi:hypothetical protein
MARPPRTPRETHGCRYGSQQNRERGPAPDEHLCGPVRNQHERLFADARQHGDRRHVVPASWRCRRVIETGAWRSSFVCNGPWQAPQPLASGSAKRGEPAAESYTTWRANRQNPARQPFRARTMRLPGMSRSKGPKCQLFDSCDPISYCKNLIIGIFVTAQVGQIARVES